MAKKPKKTWTFDEWFVAQHGKCPSAWGELPDLARELAKYTHLMNKALLAYQARKQWEDKRTSARYAWNIKDRQKRVKR